MRRTTQSGFTLIELVVTVAIVAILASVALPLNDLVAQRSKEDELRRALREVRQALDAHKQAFDDGRILKRPNDTGYPKTLDVLVEGVADQRSPNKDKVYFLRRIPRDPLRVDNNAKPADTWGKRSYASAPDEPKDGDDVFDVFTPATGKGINGRPYREW